MDLNVVNTFLHVPTFKMETAEVVRASLQGEWVASVDVTHAYFYVPIHSKFQKYLRAGSDLPVQSPTLRDCNCSFGVYSIDERGKIYIPFTRGLNPSVSGQLAGESQRLSVLFSRCSKIAHSDRKIGVDRQFVDSQFEKIRAQTNSGYRVSGLSLQPSTRFGLAVTILQGHTTTTGKLMSPIGVKASIEKTVPLGRIHMRPF